MTIYIYSIYIYMDYIVYSYCHEGYMTLDCDSIPFHRGFDLSISWLDGPRQTGWSVLDVEEAVICRKNVSGV